MSFLSVKTLLNFYSEKLSPCQHVLCQSVTHQLLNSKHPHKVLHDWLSHLRNKTVMFQDSWEIIVFFYSSFDVCFQNARQKLIMPSEFVPSTHSWDYSDKVVLILKTFTIFLEWQKGIHKILCLTHFVYSMGVTLNCLFCYLIQCLPNKMTRILSPILLNPA